MNALIYIFRFVYRLRYWLVLVPIIVGILIYFAARRLPKSYEVKATIYTGIVSGFNIESANNERQDLITVNNAMDNITNIIKSQTTLKKVSMRLYAQHMMYGDKNKDNNYITAANYRAIYTKTPADVRALIDKISEDKTLENLYAYERANNMNFVYGLFNWTHWHYSYKALTKIEVKRMANSDMLDLKYINDDPGISYNTMIILIDEFKKEYENLRFGETNNVIAYFEQELAKIISQLKITEDSLTKYSIDKKIINYEEQTKLVAAMGRDYELRYEEILLAYHGSQDMIEHMEVQIQEQVKNIRNNGEFLLRLDKISRLNTQIATLEAFQVDSATTNSSILRKFKAELTTEEKEFTQLTDLMSELKVTKEGVSSKSIIDNWLSELMRFEKAKAELKVMLERKGRLDDEYVYFAPVGSIIKRIEREIGFNEQSYLTILNSLNAARLRQKNLQMTTATLKIMNPPTFPIAGMPSKKEIMVFGGAIGTFVFLMGMFIIIELTDRTLRDKIRAERITGATVLGAFPRNSKFKYRRYNKTWIDISTQYLSNSLVSYFKPDHMTIINLLSTERGDGKSFIAEQLSEYWESIGLKVKVVSWENSNIINSKKFYMADTISDICEYSDEDVIIVEYPPLQVSSIPYKLLQGANVNLLIARANKTWKDTDQLLYTKVKDNIGDSPMFLYLTKADMLVVENFTGLLPPYSLSRKLGYRFYQFGLTSQEK